MEYASLGNTDLPVSRIAFGCWSIGGHGWGSVDDAQSIAALHRALDCGVSLFDTADVYGFGHSERIVGSALSSARQHVSVATKVGVRWDSMGRTSRDCSPAYVVEAVECSLRRLQRDRVDLCQIHWPDPATPIADTLGALARCRDQGKIGHIGCCNFSSNDLRAACRCTSIVSLQWPYNLIDRRIEQSLLSACAECQVSVLAYSPLGQGFLTGQYDPAVAFEDEDIRHRSVYFRTDAYPGQIELLRRLKTVGDRHGRSAAQVAIRWVLENRAIASALVGIKSAAHVEEDTRIDWFLSREEYEWLTASHPGVPAATVPPRHRPVWS